MSYDPDNRSSVRSASIKSRIRLDAYQMAEFGIRRSPQDVSDHFPPYSQLNYVWDGRRWRCCGLRFNPK